MGTFDLHRIPVVNYGINPALNKLMEMKIGTLAAETGVHVETIRYYQSLGLMPKPVRKRGTVRRYGDAAAERLRFIKRAQGLGFTLEEVRLLLRLAVGEHCAETRTLAERKLVLVERKLEELRSRQAALSCLVRACGRGKRGSACPVIRDLSAVGANDPEKRHRA